MEKPIFGNIVGVTAPSAYVSYDQEMNLSNEQKNQARENIGATSIIDVVSLPTENIREDVLYRLLTGTFYYNGMYKDTFVCEIVNALPDNGQPATNIDMTELYTYYNLSDNVLYGYIDNTLSQDLGLPEGWCDIISLCDIIGMVFGGILYTVTDATELYTLYLVLEGTLYEYNQNYWKELNQVGWRGSNSGAEKFNSMFNEASGSYSHAEGFKTTASGGDSHAEGNNAKATGEGSHAEGRRTVASGQDSHAEGQHVEATGLGAHAEGINTHATGDASHAEGDATKAKNWRSHAEGGSTIASGNSSHAEGYSTIASGDASHAEGYYTQTLGDYQHVQGKYNIISSDYAHIVGNGRSVGNNITRSNAHTLDWSGNAWFAGDIKIGGSGQKDAAAKTIAARANSAEIADGAIMIFQHKDANGTVTDKLVDSGYTINTLKDCIEKWVENYVTTYVELYMSTEIEINSDGTKYTALKINGTETYSDDGQILNITVKGVD